MIHSKRSNIKSLTLLLSSLLFGILLAGCVALPETTEATQETAPSTAQAKIVTETEATEATEPITNTFPITLSHNLGTIVIPAPPERVIALSMGDTDMAYAFGLTPIAIHQNNYVDDGIWPWLAEFYDPAQTEILPASDVSFEHILELQPDLILSGSRWNVADLYANLSEIAPTTAWQSESFRDTWMEQTLLAGQALGMEEKAHQLIAETENQIEATREEFPELAGKTFSLSFLYNETSINSINAPTDFAVKFFLDLGFVLPPALAELSEQQGGPQAALSLETLHFIDADLMVVAFSSPEIQAAYEANPLYQQLEAVKDGRVVVVDLSTVTQLRAPSVLGIRWVIEQLQPNFAALAEN